MSAFAVYLNDQLIETVFFVSNVDETYVHHALVNHDMFDPEIVVVKVV